jgi:hypothetical protein
MLVLLDQGTPVPIGPHLSGHSVRTASQQGWATLGNGDLLALAEAEGCQRHRVARLALFGSALRDDFGPDSDVDVLVEFQPGHVPGLDFVSMERELSRTRLRCRCRFRRSAAAPKRAAENDAIRSRLGE